jgi:hypothetical protein
VLLQAQRVLSILLQHGALSEDAIAFLWQLTQGGSSCHSNCCNIAPSFCCTTHGPSCSACLHVQTNAGVWRPTSWPAADATTFEGVKTNAYSILANLGPHMEPAQLAQLFQRLQASRDAALRWRRSLSLWVGLKQMYLLGTLNGVGLIFISACCRRAPRPAASANQRPSVACW